MAYTRHGHHIPGTVALRDDRPVSIARCGGMAMCTICKTEATAYLASIVDTRTARREKMANGAPIEKRDFVAKAKETLMCYLDEYENGAEETTYEIFVVWFTKTLQNWKVMMITTLREEMYYEVTHDGNKKITYVDIYQKVENAIVPD